MRIAVTYENGEIFQHFGHTEQFKVYDAENGKIVSSEVVDTNGSGHGALAGVLSALHVDALICGGIGGGAQAALARQTSSCMPVYPVTRMRRRRLWPPGLWLMTPMRCAVTTESTTTKAIAGIMAAAITLAAEISDKVTVFVP